MINWIKSELDPKVRFQFLINNIVFNATEALDQFENKNYEQALASIESIKEFVDNAITAIEHEAGKEK